MTTVSNISEELKRLNSALIFCHVRPDGDTLSCAFSLYFAFKKLGIKADVVCTDTIFDKYIGSLPFMPKTVAEGQYDGYIAVDCATPELLGGAGQFFMRQKNTFIIDHHVSNQKFAAKCLVVKRPACALIVHQVIKEMGVEVDGEIAQMLLMGICTDTRNYANNDVDKETFLAVAELMDNGADPSKMYREMFCSQSKARAQLYAEVTSKAKFYHEDRVGIISIRLTDLQKYGLDSSVTEGFVDYLTSIKCVKIAISVLEQRSGFYRISFRGVGPDVNQVAATFGGGGHKLAAGAALSGYYEDVIDKLVFVAGNYLE